MVILVFVRLYHQKYTKLDIYSVLSKNMKFMTTPKPHVRNRAFAFAFLHDFIEYG